MKLRALLGVSDRTGIVEFARGLQACDVELIATDGTRRYLAENGIEATAVSDVTSHPEMLDGRVKTLHPAIHAGILARRDVPEHMQTLAEHGYPTIDIVCVSLYPFADAVNAGAPDDEIIEKIDIGGPTMIRAAAKNADSVAVVVAPHQYSAVLGDIHAHGAVTPQVRAQLRAEAFRHTAAYDAAVAAWLSDGSVMEGMPEAFTTGGPRIAELRYGENPHQRGALYATPGVAAGLAHARTLQGPGLSFTNWLDLDAAFGLVSDFDEPAAAIIKHTNPCGFATGVDAATAYARAFACDSRSAFGGIVAINREIDEAVVKALGSTFLEAIVAPSITPKAEKAIAAKTRLRVVIVDRPTEQRHWDVRSIDGGLLVQSVDRVSGDAQSMKVMTERGPTAREWADMVIAWRICRHVKSNAIVVVSDGQAVGVGAGQMSRVEAAELAIARAGDRAAGAVAASDAFFPMPDGLETLAKAGITAVIQPGGSKKDPDVVAAADSLGVAMLAAGERHFRH